MLNRFQFFLLLVFPFALINIPFIKSFEVLHITVWAFWFIPLFFSVFVNFPKVNKFFFAFFWNITVIIIFYKYTLDIYLSEDIALSVLHTTAETDLIKEYITSNLILSSIFIGIIPSIVICFIKVKNNSLSKKNNLILVSVLALITFGLQFYTYKYLDKAGKKHLHASNTIAFSRYTPLDLIYNGRQAVTAITRLNNLLTLSKEYEYEVKADDDLKVIFILSETLRHDRFSINGYKRETTPNLSKLAKNPHFINFPVMESCGSMTYVSTTCLFSRMTPATYSKTPKETSVTEVLKTQGFKVHIISAQNMVKVYAYLTPDTLTSQADILHARGNVNEKILDEHVLPVFEEALKKEKGKSMFIIQLMGAHYMFNHRYPESFAKWKPDQKDNFLEKNNAYDNAVLYGDFVVNEIIKLAENEKAIIFFTSDHGESLGENGRWYHGSKTREEAREQFEVPFFVYLTPKFAQTAKGKEALKALKDNKNVKNLSHDNLFHTILGCAGLVNKNPEKPLVDEALNLCGKIS